MKSFNPTLKFIRLSLGCLFAIILPQVLKASPAEQIGIKQGSIHKVGIGLGVAKFQVLKMGEDGWILVECLEGNNLGWVRSEKYWVNTHNVVFISAPFLPDPKNGSIIPEKSPPKTQPKSKAKDG